MYSIDHPTACRCRIHSELAARRDDRYRQLAKAILGPTAPVEELALVRALAEHASPLRFTRDVTPLNRQRAA